MDIFNDAGIMAIGSRLRLLTETMTTDAAAIYKIYGNDLQPKWFPVFHVLSRDALTITDIAQKIGHSHPSVSKIVREMTAKGLTLEKKDAADGRRNVVCLSAKGKKMTEQVKEQFADVTSAVEAITAEGNHDLWRALEEWESLLKKKSLLDRVMEQKRLRETDKVQIVTFAPEYAADFRKLNEAWISGYFKMEAYDYHALEHPLENIIDKGGEILVALYENKPVGVCALIKMDDPKYDYELAKMAVATNVQGKKIGWLLGTAIVGLAKSLGSKAIYLESNTRLTPAINLYYKLGFKKVTGRPTPYERADIQMELVF